jgi:IS5 family transposase
MKQLTLATVGFERYAKTTRRAVFLAEMERVVPWSALCAVIEPFYLRIPGEVARESAMMSPTIPI